MTSKIDVAREQGYSDDEILDFLIQKDSSITKKAQSAKNEGYSSSEIIKFIQEQQKPSKIKSLMFAPAKGLIKGARKINPLQPQAYASKEKFLEKTFPSRPEHQFLETAGELVPLVALGPEGLGVKVAQVGLGTAGKEIAKQLGGGEISQALGEAAGLSLPGLVKGGFKAAEKGIKKIIGGAKEKFPSGLTKLRAVEAEKPYLGNISKERQQKVVGDLNKEASKMISEISEKKLPKMKEIEKGIDFDDQYNKQFSLLKSSASKFNPEIEISNVNEFLRNSQKEFKGFSPSLLSSEDKKIISTAKAFRQKPITNLKDLLKLYRINNKRRREISETGLIKGQQREFVKFLKDFNQEIAKSFENTLPQDSSWVKLFKESNKDFKDFIDTVDTMNQLKGFLTKKPKYSEINRIATNEKVQKLLEKRLGEKEAKEVIDITKDLKTNIDAIKSIPKSNLSKFDHVFPLYLLLPWVGKALGLSKFLKATKYGYGYFLTTPARRKSYQHAIQAINRNDLEGYKKAVKLFSDELTDNSILEEKADKTP